MTEDDFRSPEWVELRADSNMVLRQASALAHLGGTALGFSLALSLVTIGLVADDRIGESVGWGIAAGVLLCIANVLLWLTYKYNRRGKDLREQSQKAELAYYYPTDEPSQADTVERDNDDS